MKFVIGDDIDSPDFLHATSAMLRQTTYTTPHTDGDDCADHPYTKVPVPLRYVEKAAIPGDESGAGDVLPFLLVFPALLASDKAFTVATEEGMTPTHWQDPDYAGTIYSEDDLGELVKSKAKTIAEAGEIQKTWTKLTALSLWRHVAEGDPARLRYRSQLVHAKTVMPGESSNMLRQFMGSIAFSQVDEETQKDWDDVMINILARRGSSRAVSLHQAERFIRVIMPRYRAYVASREEDVRDVIEIDEATGKVTVTRPRRTLMTDVFNNRAGDEALMMRFVTPIPHPGHVVDILGACSSYLFDVMIEREARPAYELAAYAYNAISFASPLSIGTSAAAFSAMTYMIVAWGGTPILPSAALWSAVERDHSLWRTITDDPDVFAKTLPFRHVAELIANQTSTVVNYGNVFAPFSCQSPAQLDPIAHKLYFDTDETFCAAWPKIGPFLWDNRDAPDDTPFPDVPPLRLDGTERQDGVLTESDTLAATENQESLDNDTAADRPSGDTE